jgi:hypothetical protein
MTRIKVKRPINGVNKTRIIIYQAAINANIAAASLPDGTSLSLTLEFHNTKL